MYVNVLGRVMFTCVIFPIAPNCVLFTVMLNRFDVEFSSNENPNPFSYVEGDRN